MKYKTLFVLFVFFFLLLNVQTIQVRAQPLDRLPLGKVTAQGWLKDQLTRCKAGMGGHLDELEPEMIGKPYVDRDHHSPVSPGWSGEISGTYWAGLIQLAFTLNDKELIDKVERWVHATMALQESDGYLGSYRPNENRLEDYSAWSANWCYRVLLSWYEATGDEEVLKSVHRGLLWFVENWKGEQKTSYAGPTLIESMIIVYLKTGDKRLADWCLEYLTWLDQNDIHHHGMASLQRPELQFNEDHVVAFGENLKHPALVYLANNDPNYLKATENGIRQIIDKCWQCTGAPVSNFEFQAPPASIHETEYCNFATYLNTFSWMARITQEPHYGDLMERILFNAAQGARKKDERAIEYNSAPNQFFATLESSLFHIPSFGVYAPNFRVACCPAQSVRIYPEYIRSMFLKDKNDQLYLPVYGPCRAQFQTEDGTDIIIDEETMYPFDETITLKIQASKVWNKALCLRRPDWCDTYRILLNGKEIEPKKQCQTITGDSNKINLEAKSEWLVIDNAWKNDTLQITFVMEPRVVQVKDVYFQQEPLRAIECGPLLFALKYNEKWESIPGIPLTPLPEGWSWFNVRCDGEPGYFAFSLDALQDGKSIKKIKCESTYPWDESPIKLSVPMIRVQKHAWPTRFHDQAHNMMPYGNPVKADKNAQIEFRELVPYGCTILRLTCFPVSALE
ncbi:MAG: glycoside hydrolase family 127 protein [Planctomycetia bacterium]|nr:glycoside hydrolase family 127 protein [Planctomycetia bacterium]